MESTFGLIKS